MNAKTLIAYGALGLPLAALNLPLYVYLPTFYAGELGLGLAAVGIVLFATRLLDAITDPLIGILSDRCRTKFGRRRPWLVLACPLLLLATFMLFSPSAPISSAYLLIWTTLAYLAWTMMLLPYAAWGAELTDGYHQRSQVTGSREAFVVLGILFAAGLPVFLGLDAETETGLVLEALAWMMLLLLPALLLVLLLMVPEPPANPEPPMRIIQGLRIAARNRPFLRLILAYLLNGIANGLPATLFLLFVAHVLQRSDLAGPLLLLYFVAGILGIPLWLRLSRMIGKHRAWAVAMLWASVAFAGVPLLDADDVLWFVIICGLSGLALGADLALPASIQADVIDLDRLQSGRRQTGLFFALWSMATKLSLALAVGIAFLLLDLIGFDAAGNNSGGALFGLAVLYGLLPVAIKIGATLIVWNFPIGAGEQAELQRQLAEQSQVPKSDSLLEASP